MWLAYKRFQKIVHLIGPSMPISYDENLEIFVQVPKTLKCLWSYLISNLSILLIWSVSTLRLVSFIKQSSKSTTAENGQLPDFTTFTLDLLYWSLTFQGLSTAWTFYTKSHCACWLLNQMSSKRRTFVQDLWHSGKSNGAKNWLVNAIVFMCSSVPLAVILLPILFDNTPGHVLIEFIVPTSVSNSKLIMSALSGVYQGLTASAGSIIQLQTLLLLIIVLLESRYLLRPGFRSSGQWNFQRWSSKPGFKKGSDKKKEKGNKLNTLSSPLVPTVLETPIDSSEPKALRAIVNLKAKFTLSFHKAYQTYLETKVIFRVFDQFVFAFFPLAMFVGFVLNVSISYTCIKMFDRLPEVIIAALVLINLFVVVLTVLLHTAAMIITEEYLKFEGYWKISNRTLSKLNRLQVGSCQIIHVKIGSLFKLKKSTLPNTILAILENLVNLLLMGG